MPCSVIPDSYTNPHSSRDARSEELTASKSVVDTVCWHLKSLQMFADNEMFCICECSRRFPCGKNWRIQLLRLSERRFLCLRNVRMPLRTLARMLTQSTPAPVGVVGGRGGRGIPRKAAGLGGQRALRPGVSDPPSRPSLEQATRRPYGRAHLV